MKLELKHLAPYLPYRLQYLMPKHEPESIFDIGYGGGIHTMQVVAMLSMSRGGVSKPILRPLSDILKDEYNFIYENETDYESIKDLVHSDVESRLTSKFSYLFFEEVFRHHFDVFGLIPAGLAIDINTLNE